MIAGHPRDQLKDLLEYDNMEVESITTLEGSLEIGRVLAQNLIDAKNILHLRRQVGFRSLL